MPGTTYPADDFVADARVIFNDYLSATSIREFRRSVPNPDEGFTYPQPTAQTDMAAFSVVFTCLWRILQRREYFSLYYADKPIAFEEIRRIVTPLVGEFSRYTTYAGFWGQNDSGTFIPVPPNNEASIMEVCRTLRNGFGHFNFRYTDVAPNEYFMRLNLTPPPVIPDPNVPSNYRVFICDWQSQRGMQFGDNDSDSRIVATHFAHLRYHLFLFLARFFSEPGVPPYKDILNSPIDKAD